jgi:CheY-like chemotaxis protein
MDINMPIMNGIECRNAINELFNEKKYPIMPAVIAYTANGDQET